MNALGSEVVGDTKTVLGWEVGGDLKVCPKKDSEAGKSLGHKSNREWLRKWGLFSLEALYISALYRCLKGFCSQPLLPANSNRMRENISLSCTRGGSDWTSEKFFSQKE